MKRLIPTLIAATLLLFSQAAFAQHPWAGAGTAQDPFRIYTLADLNAILTHQSDVAYTGLHDCGFGYPIPYSDIHFELMNNIDEPLMQPICSDVFSGYFHGKGYNITLGFNDEDPYNNTFIGNLIGTVDSVTFIGTVRNFYSLFGNVFECGKIAHLTCNLNIIPCFSFVGINECDSGVLFGVFVIGSNSGVMKSCINYSDFHCIAPETTSMITAYFFGAYNEGQIDSCINYGNISIETNHLNTIYLAVFSPDNGYRGKITNCINHGDIFINGVPDYIEVSCFSEANTFISNCLNTGNISAKKIDVLGVFANVNYGTVSNCLNTGSLTGDYIAGGIAGKTSSRRGYNGLIVNKIENCLNTGYIDGGNSVGGIVGEFFDDSSPSSTNYQPSIIRNNIDLSKTSKHALFGQEITPIIENHGTIIENNFYDKQMVTIPATPEGDIAGRAEGKLTTELTGFALQSVLGSGWSYAEGRYPIPLGLEHHPAALLAATPVYLHYVNTGHFNTVDVVTEDFTIGLENGAQWQTTHNKVLLSGENGILQNTGSEKLTCSLDNYSKDIDLNIVPTYTISGTVTCDNNRLAGVRISYSTIYTTTNANGNYSLTVPEGSNVTITPSLNGYAFTPANTTITNIAQNIDNVNFTTTSTYTVRGTVTYNNTALENVIISCPACMEQMATTNANGAYSFTVPARSNVTIRPSLNSYAFTPADTTITNITQNIDNVNFTATTSGIASNLLNDIKIYPNPATDELYIISGETINNVEIVDVSGRTVFLPSFAGVGEGAINISHLPAGFYFVKIHTDKGVAVRKIVKQ